MKNYISLMKLRVVELLLVTTLPALFLASDGVPDLAVTIWCLVGGTFAAGGANAFNMVIEAKSDLLMKRTAKRPIATGEISKTNGLIFATVISVISLSIFAAFTTPLATLLTFLAITFYVFGYTLALKKHTSQNIVWGGIDWASSSYQLTNPHLLAIFLNCIFLDPTTFLGISSSL
jgi:protoheme IX farnesyltransferase